MKSTGKVLPLLLQSYQDCASLLGFQWAKSTDKLTKSNLEEDRGIEPLRHRCRTPVFKTGCYPCSGIFRFIASATLLRTFFVLTVLTSLALTIVNG